MRAAIALLLAAGAVPEASPLAIALDASPEEITLGDHVEVRLAVEHDARDVYSLPAFDPAPLATPPDSPAPRSRREDLGGGKARTTFELTLADYATLEPRIPDLTLAVSGPDGPRQLSIRGRPLKFRSLVQRMREARLSWSSLARQQDPVRSASCSTPSTSNCLPSQHISIEAQRVWLARSSYRCNRLMFLASHRRARRALIVR